MIAENKRRNSYRVVIDTNIWISFLIGKALAGLHRYINSGRVQIIVCPGLLLELSDVLARPRIRKYIPSEKADEFFDLLDEVAVIVEPKTGLPLCRDPKDDYLLYTSLTAHAHYLVTGDDDLLSMKQVGDTQIITFARFNEIMKSEVV